MLKTSGSEDTANNLLPAVPTTPMSCIIRGIFLLSIQANVKV